MYRYAQKSFLPALAAAGIVAVLTLVLCAVVIAIYPPEVHRFGSTCQIDLPTIIGAAVDIGKGNCRTASGSDSTNVTARAAFSAAFDLPSIKIRFCLLIGALLGAPLIAFWEAIARTPYSETIEIKSGRAVTFGDYARSRIRAFIAKRSRGKTETRGLWLLPHVQLDRAQEARNLLLIGGHGSGKTAWLRGLIEQLVDRAGRTFILDVKGDMVESLPVADFILVAVADARSWVWDVAVDLTKRLQATELAAKFIPARDRDPMWGQSAGAILADLIMYLRRLHGAAWGWPGLAKMALSSPAEIREALNSIGAPSASLLKFSGTEEENRTVMSMLITLWVAALTRILPLAEAWETVPQERRFSIRQWVRHDSKLPRVLVFQKSSEYPEVSGAVGGFLIDAIAASVLSPASRKSGVGQYTMILDEFPELACVAEQLPSLLALGREAGVTTIATLQDLAQLENAYGDVRAEMLLARFGIRCVLKLEDGETTQTICDKWIKTREIRRSRDSTVEELRTGLKVGHETVREPVVEPGSITDDLYVSEEDGRLMIRGMVLGFGTVAVVDVPMTIWETRRPAFEPAPWLRDDWVA